jgi:hypothetical protein
MTDEKKLKVNVNGKDYIVDDLNDDAKKAVEGLRIAQIETNRLQGQLALVKTASSAYQQILVNNLPKD